jgi:Na+-translocating ferredoxin:NAD+ oxidoreductase RnfD subunit
LWAGNLTPAGNLVHSCIVGVITALINNEDNWKGQNDGIHQALALTNGILFNLTLR